MVVRLDGDTRLARYVHHVERAHGALAVAAGIDFYVVAHMQVAVCIAAYQRGHTFFTVSILLEVT